MPNYWYLSIPCTKENASSYRHHWFQELSVNGVKYGYIFSHDDGFVQHHYALDTNGELHSFEGSIDDMFTGESIYIA